MDLSKSASYKVIFNKEIPHERRHGYEKITNEKIMMETTRPKIGFEAKEFYEEVGKLSDTNPLWRNEAENPIYHFVSSGKLVHSTSTMLTPESAAATKKFEPANTNPATMFQTTFKKEYCPGTKARLAKEDPIADPYVPEQNLIAREYYPPLDCEDFKARFFFSI